MTFGSVAFIAFVAATWLVHRVAPASWRAPILVVASYGFYASVSPSHALVMAALTVATWWFGMRIAAFRPSRTWLAAGVTLLVGTLLVFKYTDMAVGTYDALAKRVGLAAVHVPGFVAPLGLSFVTFMLISYLVEVWRGVRPASLLEMTLFAAFFPTVVSGPIKRWTPFQDDLARRELPDGRQIASASGRVLVGAFKKFVIADMLSGALPVLQSPHGQSPWRLLLAIYALAFWIYFDFSGYSDMAIGIARLFGFRIAENFSHPYLRENLAEFWSHWHMTLTRFLTDYVFIPLGGSRVGLLRTALNTMIVMTVSGLWHGAAWHFVVWGVLHGLGLVGVRCWLWAVRHARRVPPIDRALSARGTRLTNRVLGVVVTFNFVAFAWVLFFLPVGASLDVYLTFARGVWHGVLQLAGVVA